MAPLDDPTLTRFNLAVQRTHALIDPAFDADKRPEAMRARANHRLDRLRGFLAFLGNPHLAKPVIHVGGTSGKGSTATMIAAIAQAAGLRVGLHTSPYLQSPTEKLQIDGCLIAPAAFANLVDRTLDAVEHWRHGPLTYSEIWMAMTASAFADAGLDLAVIEVGAGGRFDLTNVVKSAVSVITSVGMDHVETLGPTLTDIAWHKAGIIKTGAPAVTAVSDPIALAPIIEEAEQVAAPLTILEPTHTSGTDGASSWFEASGQRWQTGLSGRFQALNARLAIAALELLPSLNLPHDAITAGLASARIPGRAEMIQRSPDVLLDGAHNAQKMAALVDDLDVLLPRRSGRPRHCLLGLLATKDADEILSLLLPHCDTLTLTAPRVLAKPAADPSHLADRARAAGFRGTIEVLHAPAEALASVLDRSDPDDGVLATGSLYLLGNLRGHWYPDEAVIVQRTPWPQPAPTTTVSR